MKCTKKNRKGEADSALSHHIQCALTKGGDTHKLARMDFDKGRKKRNDG
jgi:hypothetical protein